MALLRVERLAQDPLEAAAEFHAQVVPQVREASGNVILLFAPAGHDHGDWRSAAVASLARAVAPRRVNGLVGADDAAIAATLAYLENAEGLTGQLLTLDGEGAGAVV